MADKAWQQKVTITNQSGDLKNINFILPITIYLDLKTSYKVIVIPTEIFKITPALPKTKNHKTNFLDAASLVYGYLPTTPVTDWLHPDYKSCLVI